MTLMTRLCAGEDSWLAGSYNNTSQPGTSEARNSNGKPRRRSTKARENAPDLRDILEDKARQTRSIYRSRRRPTACDNDLHARYNKSGRTEHNRHSSSELRHDIAQYRGAAHPLCFTNEVMDHKIPEGFKPVNIESYDIHGFETLRDLMIHYLICEP